MPAVIKRSQLPATTIRHDAAKVTAMTPTQPFVDVFHFGTSFLVPMTDAGPFLSYNVLLPGSLNISGGAHRGPLIGLGILMWFDLYGFSDPDNHFTPGIGLAWPNDATVYNSGELFNPIGQYEGTGWGRQQDGSNFASSFGPGPRPSGPVRIHLEGTFPGGTGIGGGPVGGGIFVVTGWTVTTVRRN